MVPHRDFYNVRKIDNHVHHSDDFFNVDRHSVSWRRVADVSDRVLRNIIVGLALYSTFQVLNDSFMNQWMARHFLWWNSARILAFDVALLLWISALRHPIPPPERPALLSAELSQHLLGDLLARMRAAIEELKRSGKPPRK